MLEKLAKIDALRWIRILYCYPTKVTPELIEVIASNEKIVKYIDLPLQHGDNDMLRAMNRRGSVDDYIRLIDILRDKCPDIALRSTFITGFPGETDKAFDDLLVFVERIQFDRVGVFTYSREEGTPASRLGKQVGRKKAEARRDALMKLQQIISLSKNRGFVGKTLEVLVEGRTENGVFGRSYRDAPEIDGVVYIKNSNSEPGEFVNAKITGATEYDLESS